jgi:hypothetical protein
MHAQFANKLSSITTHKSSLRNILTLTPPPPQIFAFTMRFLSVKIKEFILTRISLKCHHVMSNI